MGLFSSSKSSSTSYAYDQRSMADGEGISAANNSGAISRFASGDKTFYNGKSYPWGQTVLIVAVLAWLITRPKVLAALGKVFKK